MNPYHNRCTYCTCPCGSRLPSCQAVIRYHYYYIFMFQLLTGSPEGLKFRSRTLSLSNAECNVLLVQFSFVTPTVLNMTRFNIWIMYLWALVVKSGNASVKNYVTSVMRNTLFGWLGGHFNATLLNINHSLNWSDANRSLMCTVTKLF